jgi:hypothetical protein
MELSLEAPVADASAKGSSSEPAVKTPIAEAAVAI